MALRKRSYPCHDGKHWSVFWKHVYNVLEGYFDITLVNAQRIMDSSNAEWIAKLLRQG